MSGITEIPTAEARAALQRLAALGFTSENVLRWFGAQVTSDVRYLRAPPERPRRGAGAAIALFVGGETVDENALELSAFDPILERDGGGVRARAAIVPVARDLWLASDRLDDVSAGAVGAPD